MIYTEDGLTGKYLYRRGEREERQKGETWRKTKHNSQTVVYEACVSCLVIMSNVLDLEEIRIQYKWVFVAVICRCLYISVVYRLAEMTSRENNWLCVLTFKPQFMLQKC